ncbi:unnamed protein product [Peronospora destructor]|uniref:Peptidyl-tRNA hydrolase n=2 Tax=Peronospora destructor TaxID=86335 RepID=A0AAV0T0R3_9STRA|nr:unnamed protein product [Peronospora destructor]
MNCSGTAVRAFMQSHQWRLKKNPLALNRQDELLVITDDVALPFGECRFKAKGGPGGQNGIRDIIKCVGTERFARLRIGVGAPHWFVGGNSGAPSGTAMDKFVLGRFNGDEQAAMTDLLRYTNELLRLYLHRGVALATTYGNSMDLQRYLKQYDASHTTPSSEVVLGMPSSPVPVQISQKDLPRVIAIVVFGFVAVSLLALRLNNFFAADGHNESFSFPKVKMFIGLYTMMLVFSRFYEHGTYVLYEMLWGCNVSLVLAIMALSLSNPFLVGVAMVTVSGDHLLWYIDTLSFVLTGKFITGAMKYLTYPENRSFSKTFFATHHWWFLPVCFYTTTAHGGMHGSSFMGSCVLTSFLAAYCRAFTPFEVRVPGSESILYLNVNGGYAFWRDIDIPLLHLLDHHHPALYIPFLSIVGNLVANGFPHILILGISLGFQHNPLLEGITH